MYFPNPFLVVMTVCVLTVSCTNTLDKPLNKEDFLKVKELVQSDTSYTTMKKKYILDNLTIQVGVSEIGLALNLDKDILPTFRDQIDMLVSDYDSIRTSKMEIIENNTLLENFISLKTASMISVSRYKGYLNMTLDFNNTFDKDILYIVLKYRFVDRYDSVFFDDRAKLTDEIAKDFRGEVKITLTENHNRVAEFLYTKVPEVSNTSFLMNGLIITTEMIVFEDKSELVFKNASWEYMEE